MVSIFFTIEFFFLKIWYTRFNQLNESEDIKMDILETMKARHSVRQYKNQAIESSKREKINALIKDVNAESKLSIQVFYDEPKCFDSFMAHYGKFENVKNYIAIVGNKNDQEKAGYYGEKIVLKCQKLGLNTCWVAMTHGKSNAHIMIATARDDKESTLKGLQIGADDYICKPYDIDILIAKINGIFKRKYALDEIVCDNLKLNNVTQTLTVNQTPVNVTEKEFQLLKLLVENKGTTLKKEYLFNRIWGSDSESEPQTLTVHIKWLREKIEQDSKKPKHIITVWGTGYRYE